MMRRRVKFDEYIYIERSFKNCLKDLTSTLICTCIVHMERY